MKRLFRRIAIFLLVLFVAPTLIHLAVWTARERPANWHEADWSSSGILPSAMANTRAEVFIMAARTGGLKGAVSKHSWIVLKKPGADHYDRYDVVGWGRPVRKNAFLPDGRWYSNPPEVIFSANGQTAADLIPRIESAIANYRWQNIGDYTIWPGPNSNTFVANVIRTVPGIDIRLPATAVGKDYSPAGELLDFDPARKTLRLSLFGFAGIDLRLKTGFEINLLGLVAGVDWAGPAVKLPGFGRIGQSSRPPG